VLGRIAIERRDTRLRPSQRRHRAANGFCDYVEKRGEAAKDSERSEHVDDINGAHDAAPVPANCSVDTRPH
jgi:hypothetical protein